jgi:penicillin amidase
VSKRWSTITAAAAAVAGLAGAAYYLLLRRPLPRTQGTIRLAGLKDEVEILRDRWGVPHIYAIGEHDLLFAQGFAHAQDRLWQMDLYRRLVAGRLSEVMGKIALPVDRWVRTLSMRRVAEQEAECCMGEARALVEAYATGVNARIAQGRLPVEFALLRYKPEPWTVADTLAWVKFMSWSLSVNWESELLRAQLIEHLGPELAHELEAGLPGEEHTVIPQGTDLAKVGMAALERAEKARPFLGPAARHGLGSNNWVLAGSRTESGAPLLANDMHLLMSMPSIWYENHLVCEEAVGGGSLNLSGITFPGIPGIVSGHNGSVAWGYTAGFPDVQDLFVERLRRDEVDGEEPVGKSQVRYQFRGEWLNAQVIEERIQVKGGETVTEEVIVTRHGPIINSLAPDFAGEEPLALRWTSLEPDTMLDGLLAMNRARDCIEFREALRHWSAPVLNVVYADTGGNIAYSYPGRVPVRAKGDGSVPVPGWTGEYEWTGYIPFEELPHLYNPPQGYIASANNRVVGDDYPYELGREFAMGDRYERIVELIEAQPQIDVAYIKRMQFDLVSPAARAIAAHLGQLPVADPQLATVVGIMRAWDGTLTEGSPAAAVYQVFVRRVLNLMLKDKLGDLAERYRGKGPTPLLQETGLFGEKSWAWLRLRLAEPSSHWFDLGNGEDRNEVMRWALRQTVDFLTEELGPEIDDWTWGQLHTLTYAHMLGSVKPLDRLLNRGPYPMGGDSSTLWATGIRRLDLSTEGTTGPPFRFIADLSDLRNSWGLLAPGQSGQPGSKHYDDQVQAWFDAEYHPMLYAREDVDREAKATLKLVPGEAD